MRLCTLALMAGLAAMPAASQPSATAAGGVATPETSASVNREPSVPPASAAPAPASPTARAAEARPKVVPRMTASEKKTFRQADVQAAGKSATRDNAHCRTPLESLPCASGTTGDFGPPYAPRKSRPYVGGADLTR